jgi:RNA-binding protein
MSELTGHQRKYLRGLAHNLKPAIIIGQKGITEPVITEIKEALNKHELIKIKFVDFKEKDQKKDIASIIEEKTASHIVGMIGHTTIFYRQHTDPDKRKISLPERSL